MFLSDILYTSLIVYSHIVEWCIYVQFCCRCCFYYSLQVYNLVCLQCSIVKSCTRVSMSVCTYLVWFVVFQLLILSYQHIQASFSPLSYCHSPTCISFSAQSFSFTLSSLFFFFLFRRGMSPFWKTDFDYEQMRYNTALSCLLIQVHTNVLQQLTLSLSKCNLKGKVSRSGD